MKSRAKRGRPRLDVGVSQMGYPRLTTNTIRPSLPVHCTSLEKFANTFAHRRWDTDSASGLSMSNFGITSDNADKGHTKCFHPRSFDPSNTNQMMLSVASDNSDFSVHFVVYQFRRLNGWSERVLFVS